MPNSTSVRSQRFHRAVSAQNGDRLTSKERRCARGEPGRPAIWTNRVFVNKHFGEEAVWDTVQACADGALRRRPEPFFAEVNTRLPRRWHHENGNIPRAVRQQIDKIDRTISNLPVTLEQGTDIAYTKPRPQKLTPKTKQRHSIGRGRRQIAGWCITTCGGGGPHRTVQQSARISRSREAALPGRQGRREAVDPPGLLGRTHRSSTVAGACYVPMHNALAAWLLRRWALTTCGRRLQRSPAC